jgi:predicted ATPase
MKIKVILTLKWELLNKKINYIKTKENGNKNKMCEYYRIFESIKIKKY